jgi:hypothetical protein
MTDEELWGQAKEALPNQGSVYGSPQYLMDMGTKIVYHPSAKRIDLYNMTLGGDFYEEFKPDEYDYFLEFGWAEGLRWMSLKNYRRRLAMLEQRLKQEQYQGEQAQEKIKYEILHTERKVKKLWR